MFFHNFYYINDKIIITDDAGLCVEKLNGKERSGVLYQFDYNSEQFNVGDEIVVEFKYPIANSIPYGLTDVNIYKSE